MEVKEEELKEGSEGRGFEGGKEVMEGRK